MNTLRAHMGSDTALTVWLRDEDGKVTFSSDTAKLYLYPYGHSVLVEEAGITGTVADGTPGRASFTITEEYADANLYPGSFRYVVELNDVWVADGLLEVV